MPTTISGDNQFVESYSFPLSGEFFWHVELTEATNALADRTRFLKVNLDELPSTYVAVSGDKMTGTLQIDNAGKWLEFFSGGSSLWDLSNSSQDLQINRTGTGTIIDIGSGSVAGSLNLNGTSVTFNNDNANLDFIINKNTSGQAFKYDAGTDDHTFNSDVTIAGSTLSVPNGMTNGQVVGTGNSINGSLNTVNVFGNDNTIPSATDNTDCFGYSNFFDGGGNNVVVGSNNFIDEDQNIIIGRNNSTDSQRTVIVGASIYSGGENNVFVGLDCSAFAIGTKRVVCIGNNSTNGGKDAVVVGYNGYATGDGDVVVGSDAIISTNGTASMALGWGATVYPEKYLQIGSNSNTVTVSDASLYTHGETVTGSSTGATGTVVSRDFGAPEKVVVSMSSDINFSTSDNLNGATSGETQSITAVDTIPNAAINNIRFNRGTGEISFINPVALNTLNASSSGNFLTWNEDKVLEDSGIAKPTLNTTTSATYNASPNETILADSTSNDVVVLLPSTKSATDKVLVKRISAGANSVSISGNGFTIDGDNEIFIVNQWDWNEVVSNGTNWYIIG